MIKACGPSLLLLHGGGLSGKQWQPQFERLSDYHCLVPDLPGHGESRAIGVVGLEETGARLLDMLHRQARHKPVHIVGSSFGGMIALYLLGVAPERIETVLVSGSTAGLGRILGAVAKASTVLYRMMTPETLVRLSYAQFGIPESYRETFYADLLHTANRDFALELHKTMMAFELPEKVRIPVLAAVGQRETVAAKQAARKIVASLPTARGVLVPNVGHVWNLQAPDLFTATVRAWMTQTPLPTALWPLNGPRSEISCRRRGA